MVNNCTVCVNINSYTSISFYGTSLKTVKSANFTFWIRCGFQPPRNHPNTITIVNFTITITIISHSGIISYYRPALSFTWTSCLAIQNQSLHYLDKFVKICISLYIYIYWRESRGFTIKLAVKYIQSSCGQTCKCMGNFYILITSPN